MFEGHVDFDGGVACNRRGDARPHCFQIDGLVFARELLEDFVQHVLDARRIHPRRRDLHRHAARAKGFRFKTVVGKFLGNVAEDRLLRRSQFNDQRHEQTLAFDPPRRALPQHSLEQHPLVGHMLIDDPEAVFVDGKNE